MRGRRPTDTKGNNATVAWPSAEGLAGTPRPATAPRWLTVNPKHPSAKLSWRPTRERKGRDEGTGALLVIQACKPL